MDGWILQTIYIYIYIMEEWALQTISVYVYIQDGWMDPPSMGAADPGTKLSTTK